MVSATHTHSAPAAMGCLGTRPDKEYIATLPERLPKGSSPRMPIEYRLESVGEPSKIGKIPTIDVGFVNRKRRLSILSGKATGLAHMHPGYLSPDVIGPSGPVDPTLSVIAMQTNDGQPTRCIRQLFATLLWGVACLCGLLRVFLQICCRVAGVKGEGMVRLFARCRKGPVGLHVDGLWGSKDRPDGATLCRASGSQCGENTAEHRVSRLGRVEHRRRKFSCSTVHRARSVLHGLVRSRLASPMMSERSDGGLRTGGVDPS